MTIDIVMTRSVPAEAGTTTTIIRTKEPSDKPSLLGIGVVLGILFSEPAEYTVDGKTIDYGLRSMAPGSY